MSMSTELCCSLWSSVWVRWTHVWKHVCFGEDRVPVGSWWYACRKTDLPWKWQMYRWDVIWCKKTEKSLLMRDTSYYMIKLIIQGIIIEKCQNCVLTQMFRVCNPSSVWKITVKIQLFTVIIWCVRGNVWKINKTMIGRRKYGFPGSNSLCAT